MGTDIDPKQEIDGKSFLAGAFRMLVLQSQNRKHPPKEIYSIQRWLNSLDRLNYTNHHGRPTVVLKAWMTRDGDCKTDICPFCGGQHRHGTASGHRIAHCGTGQFFLESVRHSDGTLLLHEDGYIIEMENND